MRRQAEDAGLETVGLHWLLAFTEGYYLTSSRRPIPVADRRILRRTGQTLPRSGRPILVLGSPKQRNLLPGVSHDQALEYAADVIRGPRRRCKSAA